MKLTKLLMLVLISSFIGLVSCDEDASSTVGTNDSGITVQELFPMTVGSWWTYETSVTDEAGNKIGDSGFDSVYVAGIETVDGFDAYEIVTVETDSEGYTSTYSDYYRYDGNKVMMYFTAEDDEFANEIDNRWVTFTDPQKSSWSIINESFTTTITEQEMEFDMDVDFVINGGRESESTYNYHGTDYKSMTFIITGDIDASGEIMGQTISVNTKILTNMVQAAGIGNVEVIESNEITGTMGEEKDYSKDILINYYIAD